jgi:multidrug efflux pump subunit AcrB
MSWETTGPARDLARRDLWADETTWLAVARQVKELFKKVPYIVDVDDSWGHRQKRLNIAIDEDRIEFFHVRQSHAYETIQALFGHRKMMPATDDASGQEEML